jgi:heat-inducible transcriptional repressor
VLADLAPEGITIRIGHENTAAEMQNLSMVTARYEIGGKLVGTIGVLGPTRMDYGRVVSVVERITRHLTDSLAGKNTRCEK